MVAKREKGACFNCTKQFSREHLKVCPMKGVSLLEMDASEHTDELDDATPLISLNAITGIAAVETMKLLVHIQDATVTALVDFGSTHSFVSLDTACHLHLEPLF
jgi:acetyl-CoA carboxylase carboxyltransferase component